MTPHFRRSLHRRPAFRCCVMASTLAAMTACTPAMNWREVRPQGAGVSVQLPCKSSSYARAMTLAGTAVEWQLLACSAAGQTWALAYGRMADPGQVGASLRALLDGAQANLAAQVLSTRPWSPPGATPNDQAARIHLQGKFPDGRAVVEELAVFTRGMWIYQASVLGAELAPEATEQFFASLRLL